MMSVFLERLRVALAADYEVLDELASGGMGVVYRARDRTLDRLVAIKVIRPDQATASTRERFLREARVLASFSHPNIVPVHRAGEADGMAYYVMDFLAGETLADRLRRGPLTADEFRMVADHLLAALEVVHQHGVVHRDVKPSNIFMTTGRAVLSDFGISKSTSPAVSGLTVPGAVVGTPGYMPPEQLAGGEVNERSDVCAAGMVLFEACTGRSWTFDSHTDQVDWSRVPGSAAPAIRRALAWAPVERWPNAGEFRRALSGRARPSRRWMIGLAAGAAALVLAARIIRPPAPAADGRAVSLRILPLTAEEGVPAGFGDSIAVRLVRLLGGAADFSVSLAGPGETSPVDLELAGSVAAVGDSFRVRLSEQRPRAEATPVAVDRIGGADLIDSLAHDLLFAVFNSRDRTFGDLPRDAMPHSPTGLSLLARAEALYAQAQWSRARQAYDDALSADSSCALCDLRLMTILQWLRVSPGTARTQRLVAEAERFSAPYRQVILAGTARGDRWAIRDALVTTWPRFDLGHFTYGDEVFHRGPLSGRPRADAIGHFQTVVNLRPSFAPAWEHLAWVAIAEGDSAAAAHALDRYHAYAAQDDPETLVVTLLLRLGNAWRFGPADVAAAMTDGALANPRIRDFADLNLGPRYLMGFDAPAGVIYLGRRFADWSGRNDLRSPGLVAQIVGQLALGRAASARVVIEQLRGESPRLTEYALSSAEFEAALVLFDSLDAAAALPRLDSLLGGLSLESNGTAAQRRRAAWMLTLVARRAGATARAHAASVLVHGESGLRPFATLLTADSIAATDPDSAVRLSEGLLALDSAGAAGDPFFRSALHLLRAGWQARAGNTSAAIGSLGWHENYDLVGAFEGLMEASDADAAFGTLGRWYRALLMDQAGTRGRDMCAAYADVARLWADGDERYRERAARAATVRERPECAP
jgi:predicted Ser/Thr protein kinase